MTFRYAMAAAALTAIGLLATSSHAGIQNSKHDFSKTIGNGQICMPCHAPHGSQKVDANGNLQAGPLWNHTMSTIANGSLTLTMYSPDGLPETTKSISLDNNSMLCMSCHDGTVALDSFGGAPASNGKGIQQYTQYAYAWIGSSSGTANDLSGNHPIGTAGQYPTTNGTTSTVPYMYNPSVWAGNINLKQISGQTGYYVGCTSCHEPHNRKSTNHMLWVSNDTATTIADGSTQATGSALCLSCHKK